MCHLLSHMPPGITVKNMDEAEERISTSLLFGNDEIEKAVRIIKSLISQKHIAKAQDSEAESPESIYPGECFGTKQRDVISVVGAEQKYIGELAKIYLSYLQNAGDSGEKSQSALRQHAKQLATFSTIFPMSLYEYHKATDEYRKRRNQHIQKKRHSDVTLFSHRQGIYA